MLFSIGAVVFVAAALSIYPTLAQNASNQPNVVFILSDDQDARMDSLSHMQQVQSLLMDQGTQFTKHYAHVALCCPSRVTLWTGQHAHNVTDVGTPYGGWPKVQNVGLWNKYLPVWLNENGVNTYYSGKLYNAHSVDNYNREGKYAAGWTESVSSCQPRLVMEQDFKSVL
jgi:N-acetylglucosamine-6-sulfatase